MFYKNFLEVNKQNEPEKYHILHDLEIHGKSVIVDVDKKTWWIPLSIEIGHAANTITDSKTDSNSKNTQLLLPPMRNNVRKKDNAFAVIAPNINVVVKEEKITDIKSKFFFIRKI